MGRFFYGEDWILLGEDFCEKWAVDLHSSKGAEFLTAEAFYALFAVDHGLSVFHCDRLRRAYLLTFLAAFTLLGFYCRFCFKDGFRYLTEEL